MKTKKKPCKCNEPYEMASSGYTLCLNCGCQYPTLRLVKGEERGTLKLVRGEEE